MVLYKFTNHYGIDVLKNLEIRITPFNQLNDPFEITPYPKPMTKDELIRPEAFAASRKLGFVNQQQWNDRVERLSELEVQKMSENQSDICFQKIIHDSSMRFGLLCLSATPDNILMWSHYSDGYRGMVIGFEADLFDQDLKPHRVDYPQDNRRVEYKPFAGREDSLKFAESLALTKGVPWKYEEEWRSICPLDHPKVALRPLSSGQVGYFLAVPAASVAAVVLGYRCPIETEAAAKWLIERNKLNVRLQRVRIDQSDQFKVCFEDIH
jgi:hypothetical protein